MALFFFVIGLELKREILVGELVDPKQAILPIVAAIGGMVVSVLIYISINPTGHTLDGWGIPIATDIAELGFAHSPEDLLMAKTGILFASLLSGCILPQRNFKAHADNFKDSIF